MECAEATFEGTLASPETTATSITATPTFGPTGECTGAFSSQGHITTNGCELELTIGEDADGHNPIHLQCPSTKRVEVHVVIPILADCTLTIEEQTLKGGIAYTTTGSAGPTHAITADATLTGIHVTRHGNALCGSATGETGSLTAKAVIEGFDKSTGTQVGVTATDS